VLTAPTVERAFPDLSRIRDARLRDLVLQFWDYVAQRNPIHEDPERVPMHPTLPIDRHGSLANHQRAMASMASTLVPTYRREWGLELDLDTYLAAVHIHDAAKVIEFVERDGQLVATEGFNHAIEAGKIAKTLGFPDSIVHMVAAHSYIGPLVLPRTRDAQLFQFLDPLCFPLFPEHGESAVERHLRVNGFSPPAPPPGVL
jgi:hypothetical protein